MIREKKLILATITTGGSTSTGSVGYGFTTLGSGFTTFGQSSIKSVNNNNNTAEYTSNKFDERTSPVDVNLCFNFELWVSRLFNNEDPVYK
jgi:hypothetical protein